MPRSTTVFGLATLSVATSLVLVGPAEAGKPTGQAKNSVATAGDVRVSGDEYVGHANVELTYTCAASARSATIRVTAGNYANWSPKYGSSGGGLAAICDGTSRRVDLLMQSTAYGWPIEQPGDQLTITAEMLGKKGLLASQTRVADVVQG